MPNCAAADCKNKSDNSSKLGISFHIFPKEPSLCKTWIHFCKRLDSFNTQTARLCSEHFKADDFERDLRAELLNIPKRSLLKTGAIPTVRKLVHVGVNKSERSSRAEKRGNKAIIKSLTDSNENVELHCSNDIQNEVGLNPEISSFPGEDLPTILNNKLKQENEFLALELKNAKILINKLECQLKKYEALFSACQKQQVINGKCTNWSSEDVSKAVTIRCISQKALSYLREFLNYPLPSERTIKRRLAQFHTSPGFLDLSLNILKGQSLILNDEFKKDVVMSFDEMKVKGDICYDSINDQFRGPHTNVQVMMIRSLTGKWKQPIYYQFDQSVTTELFIEAIKVVELSGFRVRAFVSDMGGSNRKLYSDLKITPQSSSIQNPYCKERVIWAFCDIPHVLKLLRNHLLDEGFLLTSGKKVSKDILVKLVNHQKDNDLKFTYKITESHLLVSGCERQNVRKAAELLSNTVAKAISYVFPGNDDIVNFFTTVNDGFDVLNSRVPHHPTNKLKSAYGTMVEKQNLILDKLYELCNTMRVIGKTNLLPFQVGCMISVNSLKGLFINLQNEGYSYILSSRCNQDVLESCFSTIRGLGRFYDHPLPTTVTQRMKTLLLSRNANEIFKCSNCVTEKCDTLSAEIFDKVECDGSVNIAETNESAQDIGVDNEFNDHVNALIDQLNSISRPNTEGNSVHKEDRDLLSFLAGYIAYRIKKRGIQTSYNYGHKTGQIGGPSGATWISTLSRGGLIEPSSEWLITIEQFEEEFHSFHGNNLNKSINVMKTLIDNIKLKYPVIDEFAITCYVRTRSFIRMKELNKKSSMKRLSSRSLNDDKKRKKTNKMKKLLN